MKVKNLKDMSKKDSEEAQQDINDELYMKRKYEVKNEWDDVCTFWLCYQHTRLSTHHTKGSHLPITCKEPSYHLQGTFLSR